MGINRFQIDVATGRFTLPVAVLFFIVLWFVQTHSFLDIEGLFVVLLIGYLMIESNLHFTLIRMRTALPVSIFMVLMASMQFVHSFSWSQLAPLAFMLAVFALFLSYESPHPVYPVFHVSLFLSLGSMVFPALACYAPLMLLMCIVYRSLTLRSFFAWLIGLMIPYLYLLGHAFFYGDMSLFYAPYMGFIHLPWFVYDILSPVEWWSWGIVSFIQLVVSVHFFGVAYQDKTRTRIFLYSWLFLGFVTFLLVCLLPSCISVLLPVQLVAMSYLAGHLFTLTQNRFSNVFFVVMWIGVISIIGLNLWM